MSAGTSIPPESFEQVLLRWSEPPNCASREELVHVLEVHSCGAVIRSTREVVEKTQVYLIADAYTGIGVVHSCRKEGNCFILKIVITENSSTEPSSERDPGIFAVEDFLTEEQEAAILRDLEDTPYNATFGRGNF